MPPKISKSKKRKLDECNSGLEELEPSIKKAKIPEACKEVVIDLKEEK